MTITFATIIITELDGYQMEPDNLNFIVRPRFKEAKYLLVSRQSGWKWTGTNKGCSRIHDSYIFFELNLTVHNDVKYNREYNCEQKDLYAKCTWISMCVFILYMCVWNMWMKSSIHSGNSRILTNKMDVAIFCYVKNAHNTRCSFLQNPKRTVFVVHSDPLIKPLTIKSVWFHW